MIKLTPEQEAKVSKITRKTDAKIKKLFEKCCIPYDLVVSLDSEGFVNISSEEDPEWAAKTMTEWHGLSKQLQDSIDVHKEAIADMNEKE